MIKISLINDVTYTATFINERRHLLKNVEGAIQIIRHTLSGSDIVSLEPFWFFKAFEVKCHI